MTFSARYATEETIKNAVIWEEEEEGILHSHRRENLNSYIALTGCAL
jgi:hypothetical protein